MFQAALLALVFVTWNGNWFPSGRAEHRAHPLVEEATITAAAQMLTGGLAAIDPSGREDVILCLNEMRGPRAASNLVARIGRVGLRLAVVSGYRRRDRFDQQQDAIATTLPVLEATWAKFAPHGPDSHPRGYACARLLAPHAVTTTVYAVHLKSNYGATTPEIVAQNRRKRLLAMDEILAALRTDSAAQAILGDFNSDPWRAEFVGEQLFPRLKGAGFADVLEALPRKRRGTHPSKKWGDSALDHILLRDFGRIVDARIIPNDALSDHFAVFARVVTD